MKDLKEALSYVKTASEMKEIADNYKVDKGEIEEKAAHILKDVFNIIKFRAEKGEYNASITLPKERYFGSSPF